MTTRSIVQRAGVLLASSVPCALALAVPTGAQCSDEVVLRHLVAGPSVPALRTPRGGPVIGGDFAFRVEGGAPSVGGVLIYSAFENPTFDGALGAIVWPQFPWSFWFFGTTPSGNSNLIVSTPEVTDDLCGAQATFQAVLFDASAPGGLTISNAVRLRVGENRGPLFPNMRFEGHKATWVALGDFDGNAVVDLVIAHSNVDVDIDQATLEVALGRADGSFDTLILSLPGARAVAVADVDADGAQDILGTSSTLEETWIFLGNGDGTFTHDPLLHRVAVGTEPTAAIAPDLDGDGDGDLVVANSLAQHLTLALGNGDGTFAAPTNVAVGDRPEDVEATDLDGDLVLDLVVACSGSGNVELLFGDGNGGFASTTSIPTGGQPKALALADFDEDGNLDLAVADFLADLLLVLPGNGDGTFDAGSVHTVGANPLTIDTGDLDGDGAVDVVVGNILTNDVSVLLGKGDGSFETTVNYAGPGRPRSVAVADLGSDGELDVVVVGIGNPIFPSPGRSEAFVFVGRGDGTFHTSWPPMTGQNDWQRFELVDIDANGSLDILASNQGDLALRFYFANGEGGLIGGPSTNVGSSSVKPIDFELGDLDSDGKLDLVLSDVVSDQLAIRLGNGDGTFQTAFFTDPSPVPGMQAGNIELADTNADGDLDLVIELSRLVGPQRIVSLAGLLGDGTATLWPSPSQVWPVDPALGHGDFISTGAPFNSTDIAWDQGSDGPVLADFDGDGWLDIALLGNVTQVGAQYLGVGGGDFGAATLFAHPARSVRPRVADLDEDGAMDLVFGSQQLDQTGTVTFLTGVGFGTGVTYAIAERVDGLNVADLDGDGNLDVFFVGNGFLGAQVGAMRGFGDGTLGPRAGFAGGIADVVALDLDRDGNLDLTGPGSEEIRFITSLVGE